MIVPKDQIQKVDRIQEQGPSRFYKTRLDRNERTDPFSVKFIECVRARLDGELMMTYPEIEPLYDKFSTFLEQPKERLLFHTGSDLCIKSVFETYISAGDKILLHKPGYAMFRVYSKMFGAEVVYQDYDADFNFDYAGFINLIDSSFRMAVLENPNGFVGAAPSKEILYRFVEKCEGIGVIAVIDEAYFFFHNITAADVLDTHKNLIIIRTFSKAFGLAGLRAGYILSCKENILNISRVKPMHELNSFAILVIDELINNKEELFCFVRTALKSLQYFKDGFAELGIETSKSVSNFLAVRLGKYISGDEIRIRLESEGILLRRPFPESHLSEWVRIGTASIQHEKHILDVTKEMMGTGKKGN